MAKRPGPVPAKTANRAREKFLEVLAESCNVSEAARAAGVNRSTPYDWRAADPEFAAAWEVAEQVAFDRLEREAWRRAVDGVDKPVTFQGVITDTYKEYSDRMLEILLKGHRPEKYVEKLRAELTGKDGGAIQIDQVQRDADAFKSAIAGLASRAAETGGDSEA